MRRWAVGLLLRAGRRSACFPSYHSARCRSFAVAARLVLRCGSDCPVPCDLSRLLDCPVPRSPVFFIKAFQRIRCPRLPFFVISSSLAMLLAYRPAFRPAARLSLVRSSRSPLGDVIDALPDRSPCRSACGHQSPRSACRMAVSGTRRGAFIVIVRPPCRCCLLALAWERLRLFRLRRSACSVGGSVCAGIVVAKLYI